MDFNGNCCLGHESLRFGTVDELRCVVAKIVKRAMSVNPLHKMGEVSWSRIAQRMYPDAAFIYYDKQLIATIWQPTRGLKLPYEIHLLEEL